MPATGAVIKRHHHHKITAFFTPPSKRGVADGATSASGTTRNGATSASSDLATDSRDEAIGASADSSTTKPIADSVTQLHGRQIDDASKHRIRYDREWELHHPWLFYMQSEGMYTS